MSENRNFQKRRYFIGIGSNIAPEKNVAAGLRELLASGSRVVISRILQTRPVGMESENTFYNLVAYLETALEADFLKKRFNAIEQALGRDRSDPERGVKDRPLDLDILVQLGPETDWDLIFPEVDSYYRPLLEELVAHMQGQPSPNGLNGQMLGIVDWEGEEVGRRPREIG